jgi:A/G-specific adenine glycosylase
LLAWYDGHRRDLPWRAPPGVVADPYAVWLSEIMLQQTTVATVKGYYADFLRRWPTLGQLAAAPVEDVMRRWAGLGYYSRARNLHACAQLLAERGGFPNTEAGLLALPGIGPYTAAAVAAIAFGRRAVVVDGNVERVIARLHALATPVRDSRALIRRWADARTPDKRPGDYAQAMMDLGATICTPRRPACVLCPLRAECIACRTGRQEELPVKAVKAVRAERQGSVFYVRRAGDVLVRTRPAKGLLGGMTEFPGTPWLAGSDGSDAVPPLALTFDRLPTIVEHGFTHFLLRLTVHVGRAAPASVAPEGCRWVSETDLPGEALPTLMRKVAEVAQAGLNGIEAGAPTA